ncbi:Phosphoglucosamine mutase [Aquimixticola soesokkakensis]|uniref:Phosphoglucosamine mutase n=1 Tax=Aquimixticola soesokkakensis TaxID=1519096 RepID=A0A1Y5RQ24_9RHOB|nr:phosphomannomutase [Aquimixticola soesokkakensis]SLN22764.1 Phosphoglucosamine mutase [Aquimixticola soesokkakensis]
MAPSFGTSGLRGLVVDLTDDLIADYLHAFLTTQPDCDTLYLGRDLRPSSPAIAQTLSSAAQACGIHVVDCGALATPALALASLPARAMAIMVTGSHIPADRNGLKFYSPEGEISKEDEVAISAAYAQKLRPSARAGGSYRAYPQAQAQYVARYVEAFGKGALEGLRIGVYRHSCVARDAIEAVLTGLGAQVVPLAHSDSFIPVDTEAVDPQTRADLVTWARDHTLDAVVSADGDADRPLLADASGTVIPGDVLGVLSARYLKAAIVVTPVSSNDMVRRCPEFEEVILTRIGSPFVIAGMAEARAAQRAVVGFEANGGFLLGFDAQLAAPLSALATRDCLLPVLAPLHGAKLSGQSLAQSVAALPPCFTTADRLQDIDRARAHVFLTGLIEDPHSRAAFFAPVGRIATVDLTDGLRVNFDSGDVAHLRPSGNAPEFRVYAQAADQARARDILARTLVLVSDALTP